MKRNYCNYCGHTLTVQEVEGRPRLICTDCARIHYENPLPVASMLVPNERHEVLLVKRSREPLKGMWCLPIGFAELGESIEEAACREVEEEAGIRAEVVQLLDVSSHFEPFYGDLLIVTFEGRKTGGEEQGGDDADEARYFAPASLPRLAFSPQRQAVANWLARHQDEWAIRSAMEALVLSTQPDSVAIPRVLPSDELRQYVAASPEPIIELWLQDVTSHPTTPHLARQPRAELSDHAGAMLRHFGRWLPAGRDTTALQEHCAELGRLRAAERVPLAEELSALSLLKKHIWSYHVQKGFWERPIDVYRVLELDKRVTYFFDVVSYHVTRGYEQARPATGTGKVLNGEPRKQSEPTERDLADSARPATGTGTEQEKPE